MRPHSITTLVLIALSVSACGPSKPHDPSIGEAYVGPATLKIRADMTVQSASVATVQHGDHLDILQRRRRLLRVRTASGAEGWTDERLLLAPADMTYLRDLAKRAATMPAQGQATSYGDLNVHTQPARLSPSFFQIKEKEKVDVLLHLRAPRTDFVRPPLVAAAPKKAKAPPRKSATSKPKYPPPPMPAPPPLPSDWLELSKTDLGDDETPSDEGAPAEPKLVPTDDWSLVRNSAKQSGWVLTRRLTMGIPDEVAQYAEGRRIVSYFSLGKTDDDGVKKDIWLWTTVIDGPHPYDFESFRVFIWSLRRHRYETAHIERNLKGYAPVLVNGSNFSVCIEKKDGSGRARREYTLIGNSVRFASETVCEPQPAPEEFLKTAAPGGAIPTADQPQTTDSFTQRMKRRLQSLFHRQK